MPNTPSASLAAEEDGAHEVVALGQLAARDLRSGSRPFSMNMARSANASATFSDCSTTIIVWPARLQLLDDAEQLLDDQRREAERQLVDEQDLGLVHERHREREHLLLAAREIACGHRAPVRERRERLEHALDAGLPLGRLVFVASSDVCRFSPTRELAGRRPRRRAAARCPPGTGARRRRR